MTDAFESRIKELAHDFPYPPTPRVDQKVMARIRVSPAPRVGARRLVWGLAIVLTLLAGLMAVPPVRAAVLEFIRIGVVRIFPAPTATATVEITAEATVEAPVTALPQPMIPMTATPGPAMSSLVPVLRNIAGETTLEGARQDVRLPIPLPTYPTDLGEPDHVFVQNLEGDIVILVWIDPADLEQVRMSLHIIEEGSWAVDKIEPLLIQETTVNGQRAIWAIGPYPVIVRNRNTDLIRMINGHVLIWAEGDVTYRLETDVPLEEAIRIAESLSTSP
jgi:hypothetical protein